jgi:hypothetical protein
MGLIRLFLYDQPMSFCRFAVELSAAACLLALIGGLFAATSLTAMVPISVDAAVNIAENFIHRTWLATSFKSSSCW